LPDQQANQSKHTTALADETHVVVNLLK